MVEKGRVGSEGKEKEGLLSGTEGKERGGKELNVFQWRKRVRWRIIMLFSG